MALPHDDAGTGPAVVLLHAGIADRSMWSDLVPALVAAGHRAIAVDLPGFGEVPDTGQAPWSAVLETMDALGVDRAPLIGSSYGGAVALRAAAVAPERITGLLMVSAPAPNLEPSPELEAVWEAEESALERGDVEGAVAAVVAGWTLPEAPAELRERVAAMQRRLFALRDGAAEPEPAEDPLEPDDSAMADLAVPALVAAGERDLPDFVEGARAMAERLPDARLVLIPGAGHLAPLEQPEAFERLALGFLADRG